VTAVDKQCPVGHAVRVTDDFCQSCGAPLARLGPDDVITCPRGHPVLLDDAFCGTCGAGLARSRLGGPGAVGAAGFRGGPFGPNPQDLAAPLNGFAVASLALSLTFVLLVFYLVTGTVALVLGILALRQIRVRHERGRGLALAGVVISGVALVITLIVTLVVLFGVGASGSGTTTNAWGSLVAPR
jgi:Domain of unknown function (DUF4190)